MSSSFNSFFFGKPKSVLRDSEKIDESKLMPKPKTLTDQAVASMSVKEFIDDLMQRLVELESYYKMSFLRQTDEFFKIYGTSIASGKRLLSMKTDNLTGEDYERDIDKFKLLLDKTESVLKTSLSYAHVSDSMRSVANELNALKESIIKFQADMEGSYEPPVLRL